MNVSKNLKSRYHIEHYETHFAKIQILTLKAYKQVFNDIQNWKDNFKLSRHREATEAEVRLRIVSQEKTNENCFRAAQTGEITVHLV